MKFTLNHRFLRPDKTLTAQIRQKLSKLESLVKIEAAEVTLERNNESSPPFSAKVLLVIPGPDLHAEEKDHTPAATLNKVLDKLARQIRHRKQKSIAKRRTEEARPWNRLNSSPSFQGV
jgi:ribosomal subunit interface protein